MKIYPQTLILTSGVSHYENPIYTYRYINKDGNPSAKSTRHVDAKVNTQKENQGHQNNSNKMESGMLKGHPMPQIS
jgi:hypothetical protein